MLIFGGYTLVSAGLYNFKFDGWKLVKYWSKDRNIQLLKSDKEWAPSEISENKVVQVLQTLKIINLEKFSSDPIL